MVLPYVISRKAIANLEDIYRYTARTWSVAHADRYYKLIFDEVNHICRHPDGGRDMSHVRKAYRASKVKSHLIFYRVHNETIEIIRILHERMDVKNRLKD